MGRRSIPKGAVIIDARLALLRIRIRTLRHFYVEGEEIFSRRFNELTKWMDDFPDDQMEGAVDFFVGERDDLEDLRELKRHFSVIGLFRVIEMFLRRTLRHLRNAGAPVEGRIRRMSLDKMKKAFRSIDVPITEPNDDWHALMGLKLVRHCIVHYDGRPPKEMAYQLRDAYGFPVIEKRWRRTKGGHDEPVAWKLQISNDYFEKSADLVERICGRAVRGYRKNFGRRRKKTWVTRISEFYQKIRAIIFP